MKRTILTLTVLCLAEIVCGVTNPTRAADKKPQDGQITGLVQMIDKDKSSIVVRKVSVQREVIYNSDTKWMYGTQANNKPGSLDQLKEGWYVNCKGTFDGVKLVASACRFRESK